MSLDFALRFRCIYLLFVSRNTSVMWHSSEIVRRVSSRVLESSSGSQYELVGPMSKTNCSTKCLYVSQVFCLVCTFFVYRFVHLFRFFNFNFEQVSKWISSKLEKIIAEVTLMLGIF